MFNSNPIEINKSSLVSLKAEILRKQQEVNLCRLQEKPPVVKHVTKTKKKQVHTDKEIAREIEENTEENRALLMKSREMLESKTHLYNSLSKGGSNLTPRDLEISKRCLVQFDKKEPSINISDESDGEYHSDEYEPAKNPDEEWVEYVDFLGRTRKCLQKDLEYMKRKDREISSSLDSGGSSIIEKPTEFVKEVETTQNEEDKCEIDKEINEESELLSSDMRREILRRDWEREEQELLNKNNIHYQDVLFNEARSHGVGYYAFSKDEEERAKQQQNLKKLREETAQQQKSTSEMKKIREAQLAARLKAARNRKRARMGLPPEEDEPEISTVIPNIENEEEKRIKAEKEAEEKKKQEERSRFVRPWDIGKEILKKHYEHSQEEWVSKKREQRNKDFAPPSTYSDFNPKRIISDDYEEPPDKTLFFTSKKTKISDNSSTSFKINEKKTVFSENETDYSGNNLLDSKSLEESVLAGLRFLREQSEKRDAPNEDYT